MSSELDKFRCEMCGHPLLPTRGLKGPLCACDRDIVVNPEMSLEAVPTGVMAIWQEEKRE